MSHAQGGRRVAERVVWTALIGAPAAAVLAVALRPWPGLAVHVAAVAGTLMAVGLLAGFDLDRLRQRRPGPVAGTRYAEMRQWARLRTLSLLLSGLVTFSGLALVVGLLRRVGWVDASWPAGLAQAASLVLAAALVVTASMAQHQALRMRLEHDRSDLARLGVVALTTGALLVLGLGLLIVHRPDGLGVFVSGDGAAIALAAIVLLAAATFVSRGLPTPFSVYDHKDLRGYGPRQVTYTRAVLVPTLVAFVALFSVVLVFVAYGFGTAGLFRSALGSPLSIALLGLLTTGVLVALGAAVFLVRTDRPPTVVAQARRWSDARGAWIIGGSLLSASAAFVGAAVTHGAPGADRLWVHLFGAGWLVLLGPYGFHAAREARRVRRMEERLPDFLRDVAASHRGGLTIPAAIRLAGRGDYGALTGEVQKMADQLSWDVPLEEVLARFSDRVRTPLVQRSVALILEAGAGGGHTVDVLLAVGADARTIKGLESERRLSMGMYAVVIHITFLVFLLVAAVLYVRFVPEMAAAGGVTAPAGATGTQALGFAPISPLAFRDFYYVAAVLQGVGNGIVAGLMATGRWQAGLRHAALMVAAAWATFALL